MGGGKGKGGGKSKGSGKGKGVKLIAPLAKGKGKGKGPASMPVKGKGKGKGKSKANNSPAYEPWFTDYNKGAMGGKGAKGGGKGKGGGMGKGAMKGKGKGGKSKAIAPAFEPWFTDFNKGATGGKGAKGGGKGLKGGGKGKDASKGKGKGKASGKGKGRGNSLSQATATLANVVKGMGGMGAGKGKGKKGRAKGAEPPMKGAGKGKGRGKGPSAVEPAKGAGKGKGKGKGKASAAAAVPAKGAQKGKGKGKAKGKVPAAAESSRKGAAKGKAKGKGKETAAATAPAKGAGKAKGKGKTADKGKGKGKANAAAAAPKGKAKAKAKSKSKSKAGGGKPEGDRPRRRSSVLSTGSLRGGALSANQGKIITVHTKCQILGELECAIFDPPGKTFAPEEFVTTGVVICLQGFAQGPNTMDEWCGAAKACDWKRLGATVMLPNMQMSSAISTDDLVNVINATLSAAKFDRCILVVKDLFANRVVEVCAHHLDRIEGTVAGLVLVGPTAPPPHHCDDLGLPVALVWSEDDDVCHFSDHEEWLDALSNRPAPTTVLDCKEGKHDFNKILKGHPATAEALRHFTVSALLISDIDEPMEGAASGKLQDERIRRLSDELPAFIKTASMRSGGSSNGTSANGDVMAARKSLSKTLPGWMHGGMTAASE